MKWEAWLLGFGRDSWQYPAWIREQRDGCSCEIELAAEDIRHVIQRTTTMFARLQSSKHARNVAYSVNSAENAHST